MTGIKTNNFIKVKLNIANGKNTTLVIDSGAEVSLFKASSLKKQIQLKKNKELTLIGITTDTMKTKGYTQATIHFGDKNVEHTFFIIKDLPTQADGVLGMDFISKFQCDILFSTWMLQFRNGNDIIEHPVDDSINGIIEIPPRSEVIRKLTLKPITEDSVIFSKEIKPGVFIGNTIISNTDPNIKLINTTESTAFINTGTIKPQIEPLKYYEIFLANNHNTPERTKIIQDMVHIERVPGIAKRNLTNLIAEFSDIFCLENEPITTNNFYKQPKELMDNIPSYIPNYKQIHSQVDEINQQVDKMLKNNIIEHSVSAYNSPILIVPKKSIDGSKKWRLVVDFRQLNKKILPDKFPLPRIDTILDQLGRAKYFSTLDLMSGFHQIELEPASRRFTAFSTQTGHYQFTRMPFGLNISPNSFQRIYTIRGAIDMGQ